MSEAKIEHDKEGRIAQGLTHALADYSSALRFEDIPDDVRTIVKHCVLDWLGVTLAGSREDAGRIVREEALEQGGSPQATIVGAGARTSVGQAALVNGTASHALDYDDVHFAFLGHPTVTVLPAILALGERDGASGRALVTAFVAGVEAGSRIGAYVTEAHYARGHHATGTLRTAGQDLAHYAPRTRTVRADQLESSAGPDLAGRRVGYLGFGPPQVPVAVEVRLSGNPETAARELYAELRRLDEAGLDLIVLEAPPPGPQWEGIRDRLERAAARS